MKISKYLEVSHNTTYICLMASKTGKFTAKECALLLNIDRSTFYRWLKSGKIKIGKINGRYRASDLVETLLKLESL